MSHHHSPSDASGIATNRAFLIGIFLNLVYVLVQIGVGLQINSLSLLSDAGHNFLDVSGLALSLLAFRLTKSRATSKFTYGLKKSSILIALLNTIILLVTIGAIGFEAILRFRHPEQLPGMVLAIIASVGIVVNGISALLFYRQENRDINVRSAFLHLFSDALISVGLLAGGILIYYTDLYWIDPVLGIIICAVILFNTWGLLKDSLMLSLDAVPEPLDLEEIIRLVETVDGVLNFHHVHVWAISTKEIALTGHLVVADNHCQEEVVQIKQRVKRLLGSYQILHCTLEIESGNEPCLDENC